MVDVVVLLLLFEDCWDMVDIGVGCVIVKSKIDRVVVMFVVIA